jgi:site-specific DNA-methyltransferase (adenine-specific)
VPTVSPPGTALANWKERAAHISGVQFDAIIGNPPYQVVSGVAGVHPEPLYHRFVEQSLALDPRHLVFLIPARWFTGGKRLDAFRDRMLADRRIRVMVDNPLPLDVFPDHQIDGGVTYFHRDSHHDGDCRFDTRIHGKVVASTTRDLRAHDLLVRDPRALPILAKTAPADITESLAPWVSPQHPYARLFTTNYPGSATPFPGSVPMLRSSGVVHVEASLITRNHANLALFTVVIPKVYGAGKQVSDAHGRIASMVTGAPVVLPPGVICNQSFLVAGAFATESEAVNYAGFLASKFARFLIAQRKSAPHLTPDRFRWVPRLDYTRPWTDADLCALFGLTDAEADHIDASIKDRSIDLSYIAAARAA